jgi:chromosome partitioning protein
MKVISIANQKGGCGKTTVAINLSACLSVNGKKTLLLDMDPQSHCALGLAVPEDQIENSIYDVLSAPEEKPIDISKTAWQIGKNFDLCPSSLELSAFEQQFAGVAGREMKLSHALKSVKEQYDYCIIDCPPAVGLLTFNALRASDAVIIPVETGYFSLHGLKKQLETLEMLKRECHQDLMIKVAANLYDVRTKLGREMLSEMRKRFGSFMFHSFINFNTKIKEGSSMGQAINEYDPTSAGYKDFCKLAAEVIETFEPVQVKSYIERSETVSDQLLAKAEELSRRAEELLAETSEKMGSDPKSVSEASVEKKLEIIYGASAVSEGVRFVTHLPEAGEVCLAGDFNNWSSTAVRLEKLENGRKGDWQITLPLDSGRYRYRFVVDGVWQNDPHNSYVESNPFGELNSVIEV